MEKLGLKKDKVYIIGVSGGPDSMALFDMCRKAGISLIAAHMNYQLRDSAKRDMEIVQAYCERYGITCVVRMQNKPCKGNFQAFARKERYAFFRELMDRYHGEAVLLAHQMDDHLETYIMQKKAHRSAFYLGIQECNIVNNCQILRPLLSCTKEELETYCKEWDVPFGIDESNHSDHYERNRIRHSMIEHMSYEEKISLMERIRFENEQWHRKCREADDFIASWEWDIASLQALKPPELYQVLVHVVYRTCGIHPTRNEVQLLQQLLMSGAKQWTRDLSMKYVMYSEYGRICIDTKEDVSYSYEYECVMYETTPYFTIAKRGCSMEAITLVENDFPISIRSHRPGDEINLRIGSKKINRWFIDRKISKKERRRWPIVENASGKVIFVPGIGCDIEHFSNNPTCFVLK